jgi:hypothetical protein
MKGSQKEWYLFQIFLHTCEDFALRLPNSSKPCCTGYLAYPFQIQQAFGSFAQAVPGISRRKGRKKEHKGGGDGKIFERMLRIANTVSKS